MNETDAQRAVERAVRAVVPDADVLGLGPDEPLRRAFELDSLDFLTVVESLSAALGRPVPERDYPRLRTLATCTTYLTEAGTPAPGRASDTGQESTP